MTRTLPLLPLALLALLPACGPLRAPAAGGVVTSSGVMSPIAESTVAGGLKVLTTPPMGEGGAGVVAAQLWLPAGSGDGPIGVASALLLARLDGRAGLRAKLAPLSATVDGWVTPSATVIAFSVVSDDLSDTLVSLAECLTAPVLWTPALAARLEAGVAHAGTDPARHMVNGLVSDAFGDHPMARGALPPAGTPATLRPADLERFARTHWRPNGARLVLAGVEPAVAHAAARALSAWPSAHGDPAPPLPHTLSPGGPSLHLSHGPDDRARLALGFVLPADVAPDTLARLEILLAGSPDARLRAAARVAAGPQTTVSAQHWWAGGGGLFIVEAEGPGPRLDALWSAVVNTLLSLPAQPPSAQALHAAEAHLERARRAASATLAGRAHLFGALAWQAPPAHGDDVSALAEQLFQPGRMVARLQTAKAETTPLNLWAERLKEDMKRRPRPADGAGSTKIVDGLHLTVERSTPNGRVSLYAAIPLDTITARSRPAALVARAALAQAGWHATFRGDHLALQRTVDASALEAHLARLFHQLDGPRWTPDEVEQARAIARRSGPRFEALVQRAEGVAPPIPQAFDTLSDTAVARWRAAHLHRAPLYLSVVGDATANRVQRALGRKSPRPARNTGVIYMATKGPIEGAQAGPHAELGLVAHTTQRGLKAFASAELIAELLGGPDGVLNSTLSSGLGHTATHRVSVEWRGDGPALTIWAQADASKVDVGHRAIRAALIRCRDATFARDRFNRARSRLRRRLKIQWSDDATRAAWSATDALAHRTHTGAAGRAALDAMLKRLTPKDLKAQAQILLDPAHTRSVTLRGDTGPSPKAPQQKNGET